MGTSERLLQIFYKNTGAVLIQSVSEKRRPAMQEIL